MNLKLDKNSIFVVLIILGFYHSINAENHGDYDDLFTSLDRMKNLVTTHEEITKYLKKVISYQISLLQLNKK